METASGSGGFNFVYLNIDKKRPQFVCKEIQKYDDQVPENMKVRLVNLPYEQHVVGFGHTGLQEHEYYRIIKAAKERKCMSYRKWMPEDADEDSNSSKLEDMGGSSRKLSRLQHELGIDMVGHQFKVQVSKRNVQKKIQESRSLVDQQAGEEIQAENISHERIISDNGTGINIQAARALTELADLYLSDEESLLQTTNEESSPKTQRLERIEKRLEKLDELEVLSSKLLDEHKARDLLAAKVIEQSVEIEDHKLKRDQQEAKTAAQTRVANLAIASKIQAEQEALEAKQIATEERRLREIAEKEKSALMFSNIQLSSSLAIVSAQDSVSGCQFL
jgi:hypothetical protein